MSQRIARSFAAVVLLLAALRPVAAEPERWLKGQLHAHTSHSGDSSTPPDVVVRWYREHGFDFVVLTDHNTVTHYTGETGGLLVLPGVELTRNPVHCLEPAGRQCRIHVGALLVTRPGRDVPWPLAPRSRRRVDLYERALEATRALGAVPVLNHPNWLWGMDERLLVELADRGLSLMEIANGNFERWNAGNADHPSTEALWDAALTAGAVVWGVATDDAHSYYDVPRNPARRARAYPAGGGFVMVRARLDGDNIREALLAGRFYASSGLVLDDVRVEDGTLVVEARDATSVTFIGTGGATLAQVSGTEARYRLADAPPGYVRAVVTDAEGHKAWVQPVFTDQRQPEVSKWQVGAQASPSGAAEPKSVQSSPPRSAPSQDSGPFSTPSPQAP